MYTNLNDYFSELGQYFGAFFVVDGEIYDITDMVEI